VSEQCFTSPPTQYRLYWRRFLQWSEEWEGEGKGKEREKEEERGKGRTGGAFWQINI